MIECKSKDGELVFYLCRLHQPPTSAQPERCRILVTYRGEDCRAETCDALVHKLATTLQADLTQVPRDDPYWEDEPDGIGAPQQERVFRFEGGE